jgi:hypothetical protein
MNTDYIVCHPAIFDNPEHYLKSKICGIQR